jgi:O-antigen/teichoic acid export membrane protein
MLNVLYGREFAGYVELGVLLMLAEAVGYLRTPLGRAVQAMRRFWLQMVVRGSSLLLLLVLAPWMTLYGGLNGAAQATLIASAVAAVWYACVVYVAVRRPAEVLTKK